MALINKRKAGVTDAPEIKPTHERGEFDTVSQEGVRATPRISGLRPSSTGSREAFRMKSSAEESASQGGACQASQACTHQRPSSHD